MELARELETLQLEGAEVTGMVRELIHGWHGSATTDLRAEIQGAVDDFQRRTGGEAIAVSSASCRRWTPPVSKP